jgi:hypothetical protein
MKKIIIVLTILLATQLWAADEKCGPDTAGSTWANMNLDAVRGVVFNCEGGRVDSIAFNVGNTSGTDKLLKFALFNMADSMLIDSTITFNTTMHNDTAWISHVTYLHPNIGAGQYLLLICSNPNSTSLEVVAEEPSSGYSVIYYDWVALCYNMGAGHFELKDKLTAQTGMANNRSLEGYLAIDPAYRPASITSINWLDTDPATTYNSLAFNVTTWLGDSLVYLYHSDTSSVIGDAIYASSDTHSTSTVTITGLAALTAYKIWGIAINAFGRDTAFVYATTDATPPGNKHVLLRY